MRTKKKCEICLKRFEAVRSDAKYCSGACKQKAHTVRKNINCSKENIETCFYLSEYLALCDYYQCDSESIPLILFCFIRKTLSENASPEEIVKYFDSILNGVNKHELLCTKAYLDFREKFLSTGMKVIPNKT